MGSRLRWFRPLEFDSHYRGRRKGRAMSLAAAKAELRRLGAERRAEAAAGEGAATRVAEHFLAAVAVVAGAPVSGYWPIRDELDPRPSFFLTEGGQEALPKDYDRLLNQVMQLMSSATSQDIEGMNGSQVLELVFQRLADQVCKENEKLVADQDLEHRLTALMGLLAKEDFSPVAELVDETLQIRLLNCPFRLVALQNRAVCSFDENLISTMLDLKLAQVDNICTGDANCMYTAHVGNRLPANLSAK